MGNSGPAMCTVLREKKSLARADWRLPWLQRQGEDLETWIDRLIGSWTSRPFRFNVGCVFFFGADMEFVSLGGDLTSIITGFWCFFWRHRHLVNL